MALEPRMSLSNIDAQLEAKDEEYAPLSDMPIKKLQFTPFKPAPQPALMIQPQQLPVTSQPPCEVAQVMSGTAPIQVFLRLKPLPEDSEISITKVDDCTVSMHTPATAASYGQSEGAQCNHIEVTEQDKYHFSHVFGPDTQQGELYNNTAEPLVEQLFDGQDGLVFAYGPTNSGKTFTIQGGKEEHAGILPRVLKRVFEHVEGQKHEGKLWTVWVNFMEIYNESIFDLLQDHKGQNSDSRPKCELKEHNGRIVVRGLKQMQVRDAHEAVTVSRFGAKYRQTAETGANDASSRSHSVFNIKLFQGDGADVKDESQVFAKLSVVDLAGSERARKTKATGDRLKEASNINVSLMNLGRCLEAIKWNQDNPGKVPHVVPFRHSNLTRIFQDHFINASRMVMIIAVNPDRADYDEALQALRYGCIAKDIVIRKTLNTRRIASQAPDFATNKRADAAEARREERGAIKEEVVQDHLVGGEWEEVQVDDLVDELECMRTQVYELQAKNAQLEDTIRSEVCEEMMKQMEEMEKAFLIRMEDERIATERKFERKIDIITREASRREYQLSQEETADLVSQLEYYKARTEEMQKEHKAALQRLLHISPNADSPEASGPPPSEVDERVAILEAHVSALQKDLHDKTEALEIKRRQQNDSRQVLEEADGVIRELESRLKCAEQQNDRLRNDVAQSQSMAKEAQARLSQKEVEVWQAKEADRARACEQEEALQRAQGLLVVSETEREEADKEHQNKISALTARMEEAEACAADGSRGSERINTLETDLCAARREFKREAARVIDLEKETQHMKNVIMAYEGIMSKKQLEDAKRNTENHVPFTPSKGFNTSPSYQSAASAAKALQQAGTWRGTIASSVTGSGVTVTLEERGRAPATIAGTDAASERSGGGFGSFKSPFPALKAIFSGGAKEEPAKVEARPMVMNSRNKNIPKLDGDTPMDIENCPLHLLEYMLPEVEPFKQNASPFTKPPTVLSPSAANIKASGPPQSWQQSGTKTRKLFNSSTAEAEALNNAAGTTLVEGTPIGRRTRSTRIEYA